MKLFKTILISLTLMIAFSAGAMAAVEMPEQYINESGTPTNVNFNGIIGDTEPDPSTTPATTSTLAAGNWYWAGTETSNGQVTVSSLTIPENTSGTINIVVGPVSEFGKPALTVSGGLNIPSNVIVNIYQAADGTTGPNGYPPTANQCRTVITGASGSAGITVEGTLNINSGSVWCTGGANGGTNYPGLNVSGTVTVGTYGTLVAQASGSTSTKSDSDNIVINSGSLTTSGTLVSYSGDGSNSGNPIIGGDIQVNGGSLIAENGLIITSMSLNSAQTNSRITTRSGIWSQTSVDSSSSCTSENTVFGEALWVSTGITLQTSDANLIVPQNTSLTLANASEVGTGASATKAWNFNKGSKADGVLTINGTLNVGVPENSTSQVSNYFTSGTYGPVTLNFGTYPKAAEGVTGGTLEVGPSGALNIAASANVNMYNTSTLENSGQINVAGPSTPAQ